MWGGPCIPPSPRGGAGSDCPAPGNKNRITKISNLGPAILVVYSSDGNLADADSRHQRSFCRACCPGMVSTVEWLTMQYYNRLNSTWLTTVKA